MEPLVPMSVVVASATAAVLEAARQVLRSQSEWPTLGTGLAYRVCAATNMSVPDFMSEPLRETTGALLRRTPELAAFGYVIDKCNEATVSLWLDGVAHLRGRDIYPADRQSFILNPVEILGVTHGLANCLSGADRHREWLAETIQHGLNTNEFRTALSSLAAATALICLDPSKASATKLVAALDLDTLPTPDLLLACTIGLGFPRCTQANIAEIEDALVKEVINEPIAINDAAEAATLCAIFQRVIDSITIGLTKKTPTERTIALCRRFPLFVERLQKRQRKREPFSVNDEYDVQDLLHAILRLHFDDVRPEEYIPSYGGNASRVDFYLPKERLIVEAKMTRANLGQREVTDELIIDAARYSQMDRADALVCLIYDPQRRCSNPPALESDLENSGSRMTVRAVICPQGL
jgi:hypothetical protein